jgi:hypothetical protein
MPDSIIHADIWFVAIFMFTEGLAELDKSVGLTAA